MVISQVIHKNHCLRLSFTSVPLPFVLMPILYLRCGALDRLRPGAGAASTSFTPSLNDVFAKLLSDTDVCEFDAVIMVDHPGVSSAILSPLPLYLLCPSKTLISVIFKVTRVRPALTLPILIPRNAPPRLSLVHATSLRTPPPAEPSSKSQLPPRVCRQAS